MKRRIVLLLVSVLVLTGVTPYCGCVDCRCAEAASVNSSCTHSEAPAACCCCHSGGHAEDSVPACPVSDSRLDCGVQCDCRIAMPLETEPPQLPVGFEHHSPLHLFAAILFTPPFLGDTGISGQTHPPGSMEGLLPSLPLYLSHQTILC